MLQAIKLFKLLKAQVSYMKRIAATSSTIGSSSPKQSFETLDPENENITALRNVGDYVPLKTAYSIQEDLNLQ